MTEQAARDNAADRVSELLNELPWTGNRKPVTIIRAQMAEALTDQVLEMLTRDERGFWMAVGELKLLVVNAMPARESKSNGAKLARLDRLYTGLHTLQMIKEDLAEQLSKSGHPLSAAFAGGFVEGYVRCWLKSGH